MNLSLCDGKTFSVLTKSAGYPVIAHCDGCMLNLREMKYGNEKAWK